MTQRLNSIQFALGAGKTLARACMPEVLSFEITSVDSTKTAKGPVLSRLP